MELPKLSRQNLLKILGRYFTEVVVIFIGITISFWFEEWRDGRNNRAKEREFVVSLVTDLRAKGSELRADLEGIKRHLEIVDSCFVFIYGERTLPDNLVRNLHRIQYAFGGFRPGSPTYNSSSATGLWQQLPDSLRRGIFALYEGKFLEAEASSRLAADFYLKSVQYMIDNKLGISIGVRLQNGTIVKQADLDELRKAFSNRSFLESLKHKADLMKFRIKVYTDGIDSTEKMVNSLQGYLDKTR